MPKSFQIGLLVFPNITQLDVTGPLQDTRIDVRRPLELQISSTAS